MKKQYSRKRRALRSLFVLLCVMLAIHLLNLYNFTPGAALRDRERELGIGRTKIIARAKFTDSVDMFLSGWEDRLLVTEQRWDPLVGWRVDNSRLRCRDGEQTTQMNGNTVVRVAANASGNQDATYLWLCGWVADPDVTELELRVHCRRWYGTDGGEVDVCLAVTDFQDWQGERVFLMTSRAIPATYTLDEVYLVTETGEELLFQL